MKIVKSILKWFFLAIGILACLGIVVCGIFLHDKSITVGRYLESLHGDHMLIDGKSPDVMSNYSPWEDLFDGLQAGDKILVVHGPTLDSYPGQTDAYLCLKLQSGNIYDISENVIDSLSEMGWLGASIDLPENWQQDAFTCPLTQTQTVTYTCEGITMALELPEGWEYTLSEESDDRRGIRFWPEGKEVSYIGFYCYSGMFGVCGTGLSSARMVFPSGLAGSIGTYDNHSVWDFIAIQDFDHKFAILNEGADAWWDTHGDEAMAIINTITLTAE